MNSLVGLTPKFSCERSTQHAQTNLRTPRSRRAINQRLSSARLLRLPLGSCCGVC
jgi:hypothetical protein